MSPALRQSTTLIGVGLLHLGIILALMLSTRSHRAFEDASETMLVRFVSIPATARETQAAPRVRAPVVKTMRFDGEVAPLSTPISPDAFAPPLAAPMQSITIDIETAREAARKLARSQRVPPAVANRTPLPHVTIDPVEQAIARSRAPGCKEKFAGAGLLGIPLLLADSLRDDGCIW
jgi:hypothetical protein